LFCCERDVFFNCKHDVSLFKPEIKAVENSNREEKSTCNQEAPKPLRKASEDVCKPCKEACKSNEITHTFP
jgi:hypothetical protein